MKKIIFILLISTISVEFLYAQAKNTSSLDLKSFSNQYNMKYLEGSGRLKNGINDEAIVLIFGNEEHKEGRMFVLQGSADFVNETGNIQLCYSDKEMIIKTNNNYFYLTIDQNAIKPQLKSFQNLTAYKGYGFATFTLKGDIDKFISDLDLKEVSTAFADNFGIKNKNSQE